MKQRLEHLANAATIVACIAIFGHIAATQYTRYQNRPVPPYQAGDVIPDTGDLGLRKAKLTVLLGTASTCHFCQESMPFYGRIGATARQHGARVVAFTNEEIEKNRKFFEEHDVSLDAVVGASDNKVNLRATPTLVVVRPNGSVVQAWRGKLDSKQEDELIEIIQKG